MARTKKTVTKKGRAAATRPAPRAAARAAKKPAPRAPGRAAAQNIESLSYRQLLDLHAEIRDAIARRRTTERRELAEKLEKLAASSGFSLPEILGGRSSGKKAGAASAVRFRHPSDPSLTWSGRGRRPKWLSSVGRNIERYRVA